MQERQLSDSGCIRSLLATALVAIILLATLGPDVPLPTTEVATPAAKKKKKGKARTRFAAKNPFVNLPEKARKQLAKVKWKEVFRDDFGRAKLGKKWKIIEGPWIIENGRLLCERLTGTNSVILCNGADFGGDIMVSYDCMALAEGEDTPTDLSLMTHMPPKKRILALDGYLWRFGSWDNRWVGLSSSRFTYMIGRTTDQEGPSVKTKAPSSEAKGQPPTNPQHPFTLNEVLITTGTLHHVVVQRKGPWIRMTVDGKDIFAGKDTDPPKLKPGQKARGGFYTWLGAMTFDNLVVSKPK